MASIAVSNRVIGVVGADSETMYALMTGESPSRPITYNLFAAALNVSSIGVKGSAMAVVSGDGPAEDIVADPNGLCGWDGVLLDEQPARIAVSATATAQYNRGFCMLLA